MLKNRQHTDPILNPITGTEHHGMENTRPAHGVTSEEIACAYAIGILGSIAHLKVTDTEKERIRRMVANQISLATVPCNSPH